MTEEVASPEELIQIDYTPKKHDLFSPNLEFREGTWCYPANPKRMEHLGLPYPRAWSPKDPDWQLPENWKEIILKGFEERLNRYRSLRTYLDICVRCGACADKCHFYLGSGDPKNMPVARTELMRSIYRRYFTVGGKLLGSAAGARDLTEDVLKEWFYYYYQCTECRRCSVFCPYGIDTCEITMMGRELLNLVGLNINWIVEPVSNSFRTGNHLGIPPHAFQDTVDFAIDDLEEVIGFRVEAPVNRKGAEILFVMPSADYFAQPHWFTFLGYLSLFHEIGLDYTMSSLAAEGGNFGLFHSFESQKRLNAKIYGEAKRLGVKWILGGECGHMWRVINQNMDTLSGPAPDSLEVPKSPITGTVFENARATKMTHICEFTADLIYHNKIKLDKSRNDHWKITFHDSCNTARSMGILEEPRYILNQTCNYFYDMPENTIKEKTFCCGSGAGLGSDENMEMRMRGGLPRANAVKYVHDKHDVNILTCICAIDKASFPHLLEYWVPGVETGGVHEMVGNALIMKDETKPREVDMRGDPLLNVEPAEGEES